MDAGLVAVHRVQDDLEKRRDIGVVVVDVVTVVYNIGASKVSNSDPVIDFLVPIRSIGQKIKLKVNSLSHVLARKKELWFMCYSIS